MFQHVEQQDYAHRAAKLRIQLEGIGLGPYETPGRLADFGRAQLASPTIETVIAQVVHHDPWSTPDLQYRSRREGNDGPANDLAPCPRPPMMLNPERISVGILIRSENGGGISHNVLAILL